MGVRGICDVDGAGGEDGEKKVETVPDGLRMVYREDLAPKREGGEAALTSASGSDETQTRAPVVRNRRVERTPETWLDKAIYAVAAILIFLVARKLLSLMFRM